MSADDDTRAETMDATQHPDGAGDRIQREAEFHDTRFAEGQRAAGRFYAIVGASDERYQALIESIHAPGRVLELGCGLHSTMWGMMARGLEVTAIDISQVAIDACRDEYDQRGLEGGDFLLMNAEELDLPDSSFDAVTGTGILHHLDIARAVRGCARVLRPGGRMVLMEPMGHNPAVNLYRRFTPDQRTDDEHPLLMRDFDLLRRSFAEVRVDFYHFLSLGSLALSKTRGFDTAIARLDRVDQWVFSKVPATRRLAWMAVIEATGPR
jgi:SAM-dependent methyltransferase